VVVHWKYIIQKYILEQYEQLVYYKLSFDSWLIWQCWWSCTARSV